MLFVTYFDNSLQVTRRVSAREFKLSPRYKGERILFFCSWSGTPISEQEGRKLYNLI